MANKGPNNVLNFRKHVVKTNQIDEHLYIHVPRKQIKLMNICIYMYIENKLGYRRNTRKLNVTAWCSIIWNKVYRITQYCAFLELLVLTSK